MNKYYLYVEGEVWRLGKEGVDTPIEVFTGLTKGKALAISTRIARSCPRQSSLTVYSADGEIEEVHTFPPYADSPRSPAEDINYDRPSKA